MCQLHCKIDFLAQYFFLIGRLYIFFKQKLTIYIYIYIYIYIIFFFFFLKIILNILSNFHVSIQECLDVVGTSSLVDVPNSCPGSWTFSDLFLNIAK